MSLESDGNNVFALDFGAGPKTLLAHSGWIGNFEEWIATLAPLSSRWRAVVYDHRGAGETQVPVESISVEAMVDDTLSRSSAEVAKRIATMEGEPIDWDSRLPTLGLPAPAAGWS